MLTERPSIEAMLMIFAGPSRLAAPRRAASSAWIRKNGVLTFRSMTLSQPLSGKPSIGSPQAAPALLTRTSRRDSLARQRAASALAPAAPDASEAIAVHSPKAERRLAVCSQAEPFRAEM